VNLLNSDTNQLHIVCPFEGHPVKPQTLFKSFKKAGNRLLGQIGDATPMRTGKHQVTSQYAHGP
jgi:hypothetical protein